ncbi:MAG: hypothetical protein VX127_04180 [Myxococcota bacterium]|nr:hypothetical protein [Myxococcota bacterium]
MKERILRELRGDAAGQLVDLAIDHILRMPVRDLVDPASLARTTVASLRHSAHSGQSDAWIRNQVERAKTAMPSGTLADRLPVELTQPLRDTLTLPIAPNRAMVGRLLEHGAVENLLRDLLVGALQGFAQRLRPSVPGADRASNRLRSLKRVGEGMLGGFGAELERQAEQKARDFVDSILSSVVAQAADDLCDPAKAEGYGRFRGHLWDQLLATPIQDWRTEIDKLDTELLISTANAATLALVERPNLEAELVALIEGAIAALGTQTIEQMLSEADVADEWRAEAGNRATKLVQSFAESEAFSTWLDTLLSD